MRGLKTYHTSLPSVLLTPTMQKLYTILNQNGAKTFFVGGCVRGALLGEDVNDVDLATTLLPQDVTLLLEEAGFYVEPVGFAHGTVMAIRCGETFEITTLREDIRTDGRHAQVKFTTDFEQDAARRDLTFNALYMNNDGQVTDYFGGVDDLKAGLVRFVGAPTQRLREDWLRALRFFRFYGRYGQQKPDEATLMALKDAREHLGALSQERKTAEFMKIITMPAALELMAELGYLEALHLAGFDCKKHKAFCRKFPQVSNPMEAFIAAFWDPEAPDLLEVRLLDNPHFRFSKAQRKTICFTGPRKTPFLYTKTPGYSFWRLGGEHAAALWRQVAVGAWAQTNRDAALKAAQASNKQPPCPITGADLIAQSPLRGEALGQYLIQTQAWWACKGTAVKSESLAWFKKRFKAPPMVLVVPDIHGDEAALKSLLKSTYGKEAAHIVFLGDYLDSLEESVVETNVLKGFDCIENLVQSDPRCVLLRANHEQLNVHVFKKAIDEKKALETFVKPKKNRVLLLKALGELSLKEQLSFMARVMDVYNQQSVDALRLTLKNGQVFVMTHAGWHRDLLLKRAAIEKGMPVGSATLECLALRPEVMPSYALYEAFWGNYLSAPENASPPEAAFLRQPPEGVTLIVGHHYRRRRNITPEQTDNIIFADTGAGKGGQLTALWLNMQTGHVQAVVPHKKTGFSLEEMKKYPTLQPFERRIHKKVPEIG